MGSSLKEIAQQLKDTDKKVQLIYAFNGTGKTRLSREFKDLVVSETESGEEDDEVLTRSKILYYNAFTEDLFSWDNDLEYDDEPVLKIQPNSFTHWILEEQGQDRNIITYFQRYTSEQLMPIFSEDFSKVRFSFAQQGDEERVENIKISKSEESNLVWCIFYSLLEQVVEVLNEPEPSNRETDQFDQLEYVFIDDPVTSLDENHLIELAVNLAQLIRSCKSDIRFIITTHNTLFYNVLHNELNSKKCYMLRKLEDGTFMLEEKQGDSNRSFSYHLYIKHIIEEAIERNEIEKYHFTLLRNLYEKTASFLGYPKWSDLLPEDKKVYLKRIINFASHYTLSYEEIAEPTEPEKQTVAFLLRHLVENYSFWQENERQES